LRETVIQTFPTTRGSQCPIVLSKALARTSAHSRGCLYPFAGGGPRLELHNPGEVEREISRAGGGCYYQRVGNNVCTRGPGFFVPCCKPHQYAWTMTNQTKLKHPRSYLKVGTTSRMFPSSASGIGGRCGYLFLEICMALHLETLKVILFCVAQLLIPFMSAWNRW